MALPSALVAGQVPGIAWLNAILAEQTAWTASKNGGGFNLSNVGTLTFATLGGHVAGNSKNLTGLATLSFSLIDLGVASANVSQICNIYHNANVRAGWGMDGASATMHIYAPTGNPKILSLGINSSADGTTFTEKSYFDVSGNPVCPNMATSAAGLNSGTLWRDPAATTKTAGASYTANEQAMLNEIKAYLASVVKQVP